VTKQYTIDEVAYILGDYERVKGEYALLVEENLRLEAKLANGSGIGDNSTTEQSHTIFIGEYVATITIIGPVASVPLVPRVE
jgi:hypothetical protein